MDAFFEYLDTFDWGPGGRNRPAYLSFLRAATLGIEAEVAIKEVSKRIKSTGGSAGSAELKRQQKRAYGYVLQRPVDGVVMSPGPKLEFSPEIRKSVAERIPSIDLDWLRSRSPIPVKGVDSEAFLNQLFDAGETILIFTNLLSQGDVAYEVEAEENEALPTSAPDGVWFLVNPVDGEFHPNPRQGNKPSRRSEESITSWRYMVLESDVGESADWLACLVQLPLKISAIYTSGGRSIHALVRLDASSKADWDRQRNAMKPVLIPLGADEGALSAVRLSRLPNAYRGEKLQELLYLDPRPTGVPIQNRLDAENDSTDAKSN